MSSSSKVAIIGGSLVGPAAARFLAAAGVRDVAIFEMLRRPHSQSGGVMGVRPETLAALESVGIRTQDANALTTGAVLSYTVTTPGRSTFRGTSMFPGRVSSWDVMYGKLGRTADIARGQRLQDIKADGGRYQLTFASGLEHEAEHVVFADGRASLGRDLLDSRPLTYNGYVVFRGTGPLPRGPRIRGFERFYDATAGRLFSVTEPLLQSGQTYWELSVNLSAIEYARMAGGRGPTDLTYILPGRLSQEARDVVTRAGDRLPPRFRELIAATLESGGVSGIPVNDVRMPSQLAFTTDRGASAVLLGDAAIPVRLQVGAGLNQGIAQASDLGHAIAAGELRKWQRHHIRELGPIVELGRSRAHRINLGVYQPVRQGRTAAPRNGDPFAMPQWITA